MAEIDKVRIRFSFLPQTPEEKEAGIIKFYVPDESYRVLLKSYALVHKKGLGDQMAVISPWDWDYTKEAFEFFHWVRDQIVKHVNGGICTSSDAAKEKQDLKADFGARTPQGKIRSMKTYNRAELWKLCQGAVQRAEEVGVAITEKIVDYELLEEGQ